MRHVDIDFAAPVRRIGAFHTALLAIGAALMGASLLHFTAVQREADRVEKVYRKAVAEAERDSAKPVRPPEVRLPPTQVRAINAAIDRLNLPWAELFAILETTKPDNVALLAVEPDGKKRSLVILAESRSPEHMLRFVEHLRRQPFFEDAFLTKHELRDEDPSSPYRFSLEIRWTDAHSHDAS
jgi:Fimbrial assembly protein (PilN)